MRRLLAMLVLLAVGCLTCFSGCECGSGGRGGGPADADGEEGDADADGEGGENPPYWPASSQLEVSDVGPTSLTLHWPPAADDVEVVGYRIFRNGNVYAAMPGTARRLRINGLTFGGEYNLELQATDGDGNRSVERLSTTGFTTSELPADPSAVAPGLDAAKIVDLAAATAFLYSGDDPIQKGVEPGTINAKRITVHRGRIADRAGQPLSGVEVTFPHHSEYGTTVTRSDGLFDMAANGGGPLTLRYWKQGYLPVHRQIPAPWQDFQWLPEVVLTPADSRVTVVEFGGPAQVAQSSEVSDDDGERRSTLLFAEGTRAELVLPDGTIEAVSSLSIRSTEFTVGAAGPRAMPALMPERIGYTLCVDLNADEAVERNASSIRFDPPVTYYADNFLQFPVGTRVPVGYYDEKRSTWIPEKDARVIQVLGATGGLADLDLDGDGAADAAAALAALGITDAEREQAAGLFEPGQSLWRLALSHFSSVDVNPSYRPDGEPSAENRAKLRKKRRRQKQDKPNDPPNPLVEFENQLLGEGLGVTGTPFTLNYRSDRVEGALFDRKLEIPLTDAELDPGLKRVELELMIAGQRVTHTVEPPVADDSYTFEWNGLDAYGRQINGSRPITLRLGYAFDAIYVEPGDSDSEANWGQFSDMAIEVDAAREQFVIWAQATTRLNRIDARGQGLGAWSLDVHHFYDPSDRVLYLGNGWRRSSSSLPGIIDTVAGGGEQAAPDFEGPALEAELYNAESVAIAPDGSVYIAEAGNYLVRRVAPDGTISTVAGNGTPDWAGDGSPARQTGLEPVDLACGPDGRLYIADEHNARILRMTADQTLVTVAGRGTQGFSGDRGPAIEAELSTPVGVALGLDGTVYIADRHNNDVRRVGPDGIISTLAGYAGEDVALEDSDGILASKASLTWPLDVAVGPDGSIYVVEGSDEHQVRRIGPDGIIRTLAGTGEPGYSGDGGAAELALLDMPSGVAVAPSGVVYISSFKNNVVRQVAQDGTISTVVGGGNPPDGLGDGAPARAGGLWRPEDVALAPDGTLIVADWGSGRVRKVFPPLRGFTAGDLLIPSEDGSEIYVFSDSGQHRRTIDALDGSEIYSFGYEDDRLTRIEDASGNITIIERDVDGLPTAIRAPNGQRTLLALDDQDYLAGVTNPAGETVAFEYSSLGLLTARIDPAGGRWEYRYDDRGFLERVDDPAGGFMTLEATGPLDDFQVVHTTALGARTSYGIQSLASGEELWTVVGDTGAQEQRRVEPDGREQITEAHGTHTVRVTGADPRLGVFSPLIESQQITTPEGIEGRMQGERTVELSDPQDVFSVQTLTESITFNGNTLSKTFDAAARQVTWSFPEHQEITVTYNDQGLPAVLLPDPSVEPIVITRGSTGRMEQITWDHLSWTVAHDELDREAGIVDAAGRQTLIGYDDANRITAVTLPSGRSVGFGYDENGNRSSMVMPSGAQYLFGHTPIGLEASSSTPDGDEYSWTWDLNRRPTGLRLPGGRQITASYDGADRILQLSYPEATCQSAYDDPTDRPSSITWIPAGAGEAQTLTYSYDGFLITEQSWSGAASATCTYRYDESFQIVGLTFDGQAETVMTRDKEGHLTQQGAFGLERHGPWGRESRIWDDLLDLEYEYDGLGRLSGRSYMVNEVEVYSTELTYDLSSKIETSTVLVDGVETIWTYAYDEDGRLEEVRRDDVVVESYVYDQNGNRAQRTVGANPAESLTCDASDRLTDRGGLPYQIDQDGFLHLRGGDSFEYSSMGELLSAGLSGGQSISYAYDGLGRLVARTGDGGTHEFFYTDLERDFLLTASRDPAGVLSRYFYDDSDHLFAFERLGAVYYVACDPVGTPRVVVDAAGAIVKRIERDSFGELLSEDNPALELLVGFAGGLVDPDTGLVRFGLRDYEPASGRWTAHDPLFFEGSPLNLYAYVRNDPVNARDPDGQSEFGRKFAIKRWKNRPRHLNRSLKEYDKLNREAGKTGEKVKEYINPVRRAWEEGAGGLAGKGG